MPRKRAGPPPLFRCGVYDITEPRLARGREISIRSAQEPVPRCGDQFTILRDEVLRDVVVTTVERRGQDWTAFCTLAATP